MIGVDLVHIPQFKKTISEAGVKERLFTKEEAAHDVQTLAGFFAAKEAFVKATQCEPEWKSIVVQHAKNGKPVISHPEYSKEQTSVSISHDGDYAISVVAIQNGDHK